MKTQLRKLRENINIKSKKLRENRNINYTLHKREKN